VISPLHLGVYLQTLKSEGWYIFGIREDLPLPNFDTNWGNAENWHLVEDLLNGTANKTANVHFSNHDEDLQVMKWNFPTICV
jgi:hypothetical protein